MQTAAGSQVKLLRRTSSKSFTQQNQNSRLRRAPKAERSQSRCEAPPLMNERQLPDGFIKSTDGGGGEELGPSHRLRGWPGPRQPVRAARTLHVKHGFGPDHRALQVRSDGGSFSEAAASNCRPLKAGGGVKAVCGHIITYICTGQSGGGINGNADVTASGFLHPPYGAF